MTQVRLSRVFELSRYLATKSGQELQDALRYLSDLGETTLRTLKNGVSFADNIDCTVRTVSVRQGVETIVTADLTRRPVKIFWDRAEHDTYYTVTSFGWKFNSSGQVVVKFSFDGPPPATLDIPVQITIIYS